MHPILLKIGSFNIYSYPVLLFLGFALGTILFFSQAKRERINKRKIFFFPLYIMIYAIVGARIFYILNYPYQFLENPQDILKIWKGGVVFYGGFLFALGGGTIYIKRHKLSFWKIANISAPSIALGISIGRIGCFLNGCCYGKPWSKGLVFSFNSPAGRAFPGQPLIPTQLISSADMFAVFLVLSIFKKHQWLKDRNFLWFVFFYSLHRFIIDFLRADSLRIFLNLTFSQLVSLIMGISAIALMLLKSSFKPDVFDS